MNDQEETSGRLAAGSGDPRRARDANAKQPMSYNQWNYVQSNPINYIDPTGNLRWGCNTPWGRVATAKRYVPASANDPVTTYTAAGIAVQCQGGDSHWWWEKDDSGFGLAQISDNQAQTEYGKRIGTQDNPRGFGLLCWVKKIAKIEDDCSSLCKTSDEMKKEYGDNFADIYELEQAHDQKDPKWAVVYMRRRIQMVVNACNYGKIDCSATDKFIIAGLAQNGPGFTVDNMDRSIKTSSNPAYLINGKIQWKAYFPSQNNEYEFKNQLGLFYRFAMMLHEDGYFLPPIEDSFIQDLINGRYNN